MHQNTIIVKNIDRIVLCLYCLSSNTSFTRLQRLGQYHYSDHLQKRGHQNDNEMFGT